MTRGSRRGEGELGRPRKYSPVGREGIGTRKVVRGKGGGGGGGRRETGTAEIGGLPSDRSRTDTERRLATSRGNHD